MPGVGVNPAGGGGVGGGGGAGGGVSGNCQTTGYETRIRQDCEVVTETVCSNITVTKFNKKIEKSCTTRVSIEINRVSVGFVSKILLQ